MNELAQQAAPARKRPMSMKLSTAVTLMIGSVIGSVLILVYALWFMQISGATRDGVKDTALAVARTLADSPEVKRVRRCRLNAESFSRWLWPSANAMACCLPS